MTFKLVKAIPLGVAASSLCVVLAAGSAGCHSAVKPSWNYSDFKEVDHDPFPGMSTQGKPVEWTPEELQGRIVWNLWTGDNGGFWDWLSTHGFGTADLVKVVASPRDHRFDKYGLFNQPGYMRP